MKKYQRKVIRYNLFQQYIYKLPLHISETFNKKFKKIFEY